MTWFIIIIIVFLILWLRWQHHLIDFQGEMISALIEERKTIATNFDRLQRVSDLRGSNIDEVIKLIEMQNRRIQHVERVTGVRRVA